MGDARTGLEGGRVVGLGADEADDEDDDDDDDDDDGAVDEVDAVEDDVMVVDPDKDNAVVGPAGDAIGPNVDGDDGGNDSVLLCGIRTGVADGGAVLGAAAAVVVVTGVEGAAAVVTVGFR